MSAPPAKNVRFEVCSNIKSSGLSSAGTSTIFSTGVKVQVTGKKATQVDSK